MDFINHSNKASEKQINENFSCYCIYLNTLTGKC